MPAAGKEGSQLSSAARPDVQTASHPRREDLETE